MQNISTGVKEAVSALLLREEKHWRAIEGHHRVDPVVRCRTENET